MPLSFSSTDRLNITRRQLNIAVENQAFTSTLNTFVTQQAQLQGVDNSNKVFYDYYDTTVRQYEAEAVALDGQTASEYLSADVDAAAQNPTISPFFPTSPSPAYTRSIPLIEDGSFINNKVRGIFYPTGTATNYEQGLITNSDPSKGLTQLLDFLLNGISYGSASTSTTTTIPSGAVTGLVLSVTSATGFNVNDIIYVSDGPNSGIYKVTNVTTGGSDTVTVNSVVPATSAISSGNLTNQAAGFSNSERQTLTTGGSYQMILTNLASYISATVSNWDTEVANQIAALTANTEDRGSYMTQNSAALLADNSAKSTLDAWLALPNTGVSGKYTNASLSMIQPLMTTRLAFVTSRISQIHAALGSSGPAALSQSGESFTSSDLTNPYYKRYSWLNFRINRSTGSLRRYYAVNDSKGTVQGMLDNNNNLLSQYDAYFLTKAMTFNDGSNILFVTDLSGLSVSDTITVVSETQPEVNVTILALLGTTQVKVSSAISKTYTLADKARVFKTL